MANLPFISCLLLALCGLSLSANVFISIDCGSSVSYKDELGISWTGEDDYIQGGEVHSVDPSNSFDRVMDTLRVFKNKTKNCYNIGDVKPGRIMVRASFYYGNYDNKSSPPSFQLSFDGYDWSRVNNSGSRPSRHEVIYTTTRDSVSVCVAQNNVGQFPYISAIEVRSLGSEMYMGDHDGFYNTFPLFTRRRLSYGTNATIRFPADPYDRLWNRDIFITGEVNVTSDARLNGGPLTVDRPPPAVLKTGVTSTSVNYSLDLYLAIVSSYNVSLYINWYFSEVTRLKPNEFRSFYFVKDNELFSDKPVIPPYEDVSGKYISNYSVTSNTTFSLVASINSTLPPLINAMEVFMIGEWPLTNGTNKKDIEGLASLQKAFSSLKEWTGDPCLPVSYNWEWIKCTDEPEPRVTSLLLNGFGLSGLLPDFSSMDALHTINLSNNTLRGHIPEFLATLPALQILNLENNQFNGTIPASLSTKKGLIFLVSGNPGLCGNSSCATPASVQPVNHSTRTTKNILELLFFTMISSLLILLH